MDEEEEETGALLFGSDDDGDELDDELENSKEHPHLKKEPTQQKSSQQKHVSGVSWGLEKTKKKKNTSLLEKRLPTPVYEEDENVYSPSHDTFLLMDALQDDLQGDDLPLSFRQGNNICVEVGSGTGTVITFIALLHKALQIPLGLYFATDINPHACLAIQKTSCRNGVSVSVCRGNLASPLLLRLQRKVDLLVFNPPYVPTTSAEVVMAQKQQRGRKSQESEGEEEEEEAAGVDASWAGGKDGREVLDRFLPQIPQLLSKEGRCYLVVLEENLPKEIEARMALHGLVMREVARRFAISERLLILCFEWGDLPRKEKDFHF